MGGNGPYIRLHSPYFILLKRGDILKNLNHSPGGADSTTHNWKIMSPLKISAKAGIQGDGIIQRKQHLDSGFGRNDCSFSQL
jgi:hypothetical protein